MKLSSVLVGLHAANETLRLHIHYNKYRRHPAYPTGTVGPQGPYGSLDNYSDTQLLEMIRKEVNTHRDLKQELKRAEAGPLATSGVLVAEINTDPDLAGLLHLVKEEWEVR